MKEGRVIGRVEWITIYRFIRPLAPAEENGVHQLESLPLVVIKWEAKELYRIDEIDDEVAGEGQQRQQNDYLDGNPRGPGQGSGNCRMMVCGRHEA